MQNTQSFLNPIIATNVRAVNNLGFTVSPDIANSDLAILNTATMVSLPTSFGGGIMYGLVTTNGNGDLTWTRGSDAWRTNRERLVQRTPWNLVQYSEQFDNAIWGKTNVTITANATTAPNGTTTADKVVATATSANHFTNTAVVANGICTVSVYAKASEYQFVRVQELNSGKYNSAFDLSTGVASQGTAGTTASIQSVGNGWYRCIITFDSGGTNLAVGFVGIPTLTSGVNYTGNGTSGIFIWGAQLVEGTLPQPYLPTSDRLNVPRIDYSQGTACMLLEPQRTNVSFYSTILNTTGGANNWTQGANNPCAINQIISFTGFQTAAKYTKTTGATTADYLYKNSVTVTSGSTYTVSVYIKLGTASNAVIVINNTIAFNTIVGANFVCSTANGFNTYEWKRVQITFVAPASNNINIHFGYHQETGVAAQADGNFYLDGLQVELGAFATTIIPTTTATVTRIADSFSRNNIYTNNLISASGGTWFVQLLNNISLTRDTFADGLILKDNSSQNGFIYTFGLSSPSAGFCLIRKVVGGVLSVIYTTTTPIVKSAIKWNGTTADVFVNGVKVVTATSFTATQLEILSGTGADTSKYISQMALFNTALSDIQCASLTSDVTDGFATASLYNGYVNQIGGVIENTNGLINNIQNFK